MTTKTVAVAEFLKRYARPELAALYTPDMEVQVNAAQDRGELESGTTPQGKHWQSWRNPDNPLEAAWKSFRIPLHANTDNPEFNDSEIKWSMESHVEGIGLTGWDFKNKVSKWVAFDFDAIIGHSDRHQQKISDESLQRVQDLARGIPWVTVRKSTSGNGLHLYVFLNDVPTSNHTEHAALARAILGKMSAMTSFDFDSKVDNCGSVMWIWHRKYVKSNDIGLKVISEGVPLTEIPANWRDHITVTSGAKKRTKPSFVDDRKIDAFEDLCGQHPRVPLDSEHQKLIDFLDLTGSLWWWDADHHMLVAHTWDLKQAHTELEMIGIFETNAKGSEHGTDQNCFLFPLRKGAWTVRRQGGKVQEDPSWEETGGYTRTWLNREPNLQTSSKSFGGIEDGEKQEFVFSKATKAQEAAMALGANVKVPEDFKGREAVLKQLRDGRIVFRIKKQSGDDVVMMAQEGWLDKEKWWSKCLKTTEQTGDDMGNYDDMVRHLVSESFQNSGYVIKAGCGWVHEPIQNISFGLLGLGINAKDIPLVIGNCIIKNWMLVNRPFQPEYPGDRLWNKEGAQLAIAPNPDTDNLNYPWWTKLLDHIGRNLDFEISRHPWCMSHGIHKGGDYLKMWIASMFQKPFEPLPYLFLHGEQKSGKSILHEAISLLMTKGVVRADTALTSTGGFNGELHSAVLCVVEETDLSNNKSQAYNRIKDWVNSKMLSVHHKGATPYPSPNSTHWIQATNNGEEYPGFVGDTRITMIKVDLPSNPIPKRDMMAHLLKEAPDFLAFVMNVDIPASDDRLNLPIISTDEKKEYEEMNADECQQYFTTVVKHVRGEMMLVAEVYEHFRKWLPTDKRSVWGKSKMVKHLPLPFVKGRWAKSGSQHFIGNIALEEKVATNPELIVCGQNLVYKEA